MSHQHIGKYACLEIERRYLLRALPGALAGASPANRITDRYLSNTRLRLRRMQPPDGSAAKLKLGQKFRSADQVAAETTITNLYLNEAEYAVLQSLGGLEIVKDRYLYPYQGRRYGIDVFCGSLAGLILAEVECETVEELAALPWPEFAVSDVTDDPFFTGGHLVTLTAEQLNAKLAVMLQQP